MDIIVKQQTELGSTNWGVYIGEALREGGFFNVIDAKCYAAEWASEIAAEQAVYDEAAAFEERFAVSIRS